MPKYNFDYDTATDFLTIEQQDAVEGDGDTYKLTLNVGEVGINISRQGTIMSCEVMNASQLFDVDPEELERIDKASIRSERRGNVFIVSMKIKYTDIDQKEHQSTHSLAMESQTASPLMA
jgi:uncharacterized protein YuzE